MFVCILFTLVVRDAACVVVCVVCVVAVVVVVVVVPTIEGSMVCCANLSN